jgi:AcrR family transcriptional regulator
LTIVDVVATTTDAEHPFRRRLLEGLSQSIAERGYRETTIADIVRHARTSKRTFYQEFSSKEECFIELLRTSNEEMISRIVAAVDPEAFWQNQIRQAIGAYVDVIESRPAVILSWIRDLPALGAVVRSVQRRGIEQFIEMMVAISSNPGFRHDGIPPASREMALILVGGLRELAATTVEDTKDVREIVDAAVAASIALVAAGAQASRGTPGLP